MATVIAGDPRLRKTFTYQEQGWHTEHNRNWTETVDQVNTLETDLEGADTRLALAEQDILDLQGDVLINSNELALTFSKIEYKAALQSQALAKLEAAVTTSDTTISTSLLQAPVKAGDKILAYDVDSGEATVLVIATDAAVNATTLTIQAAPDDIPDQTPLLADGRYLQSSLNANAENISTVVSRLDVAEQDIIDSMTIIQQTADDITLLASRVTTVEGGGTDYSTLIQQNADEILLRATQVDFDTLEGRVTTAEASITINADSITSLVTSVSSQNTITTNLETRVTQTEQDITLAASRITTNEGDISSNAASITINANAITSVVSDVNTVEGSITSLQTQITQNAGSITLAASQADIADATSANAVAQIAGSTLDGSLTTIVPVDSLKAELKTGNKIIIVNRDTLVKTVAVVDADAAIGAGTITVQLVSIDAPDQSHVFLATESLQAQFTVRADQIESLVTATTEGDDGAMIAKLASPVAEDIASSSISVTALDVDLLDGDKLNLIDSLGNQITVTVSQNEAASVGATTINLDSFTPIDPIPEGPVYLAPVSYLSRITQTANEVRTEVQAGTHSTWFSITATEIVMNTPVFRSSGYDGTVDTGAGALTAKGTTGWALYDNGDVDITGILRTQTGGIEMEDNQIWLMSGIDAGSSAFINFEDGGTIRGYNNGSGNRMYLTGNAVEIDTVNAISFQSQGNISVTADTQFILNSLPVADPAVAGAIWNNSGVLNISAG